MAHKFHYIYKLTDINTNEFYYGSRTCIGEPANDMYMGSMKIWKPNKNNLIKEIINSNFNTRFEALEYEAKLIKKYINHPLNRNYSSPDGKFIRLGPPSNKGIQNPQHSERMTGENHPLFGKTHSEETILKMSKSSIGKKKSEEHKQNMRKPKSEEHKQKLREAKLGKIRGPYKKNKISYE